MGFNDILKNALGSIPSLAPLNALRGIDALADKDGAARSTVRDIQNALDKNVGPYRHDPSREGSGLDLRNVPNSGFYEGPNPNFRNMNPAENSARTGERLGGVYSAPNNVGGPNPAEQSARFGTSLGRFQPPAAGSSGLSIESLYEQLANSQRGGAQGRYDELSSFLSTEGARRNAQIDSDETSLSKQLQDSEAKRLVGEDFYRDRRAGEYSDLENKLSIYGSAGEQRLENLGINPQLYTSAVGQQMGTLLGAQMQSGNDLMNRMSQLGAERASMVLGRASAGMSKERRALDASVASMAFQGSQTLSYELQDINEALMTRRIDAATAQQAIDKANKEAAQKIADFAALGAAFGISEEQMTAAGATGNDGALFKSRLDEIERDNSDDLTFDIDQGLSEFLANSAGSQETPSPFTAEQLEELNLENVSIKDLAALLKLLTPES
jgi:hypothetical protein